MEMMMMMMISEEEKTDSNSSRDSDSTHSSSSSDSPPHKRPRRLLDPKTQQELEKIKSGDPEVVHLKHYVDWFMSLGAEVDENDIFLPKHYCKWFAELGDEAKAGCLHPCSYFGWYAETFDKGERMVFPTDAELIEENALLALEYFNKINKCDGYEYVRDVAITDCIYSNRLHFYGRRKVSLSMSEPEPPEIPFFAEVDYDDIVLECRILDSEEFGVLHPPDCEKCKFRCGPVNLSACLG